jgi:hypothetical protein
MMKGERILRKPLILLTFFCMFILVPGFNVQAQEKDAESSIYEDINMKEWNNRIRQEKFDLILPQVMREQNIDMWIHVMRLSNPDPFGAEDLGSTSGVFIFTDRGGDRIERAGLGRRWGASHREWGEQANLVPMSEYDYRFQGVREFVVARDPKRIAVNYKHDLGPWVTYTDFGGALDGISHTDYLLLTEELGEQYTNRLVSSEYVLMNYITRPVPSEIQLLKRMRKNELEYVKKVFAEIVPGVSKKSEAGVTVFRRGSTGISQRGRSRGDGDIVIQGGDIVAAPSQGMYAYVLREGETEPPPEIKKLWAEYLKIDKILAETIKAGLTPRELQKIHKRKFEEQGIILRDNQLHMVKPKNNFPVYAAGFDPKKTHLSIDAHGMLKGAQERKEENYFGPRIGSLGPDWSKKENYFGPRIGSLGPDWSKNIPLPLNHHFVLEYFFYMPSPSSECEDQYLFWWDHEQAIATKSGVEYLSPPQKELYLIH